EAPENLQKQISNIIQLVQSTRSRAQKLIEVELKTQVRLAENYNHVGDLQDELQQPDPARESYKQSQALLEKLAATYSNSEVVQSRLAQTHLDLGSLDLRQGKADDALKRYEQANALYQKLVEKDPQDLTFHDGVGKSQHQLALAYEKLSKRDEALKAFEK